MSFVPPTVYNSLFLKADYRTVVTTGGSRSYRTSMEQRAHLDDIFMPPGATLQPDLAGLAGQLLLLPIVGGALLSTAQEHEMPLVPGCLYALPEAETLRFTNPFAETVNLLLIRAAVPAAATTTVREFELPLKAKNTLVAPPGHALPVQIGLYDSRVKGHLAPPAGAGFSLCYVLNGSFEIEDRLAEHRDTLVLWDTPRIDFEALSETAILFCLHFINS